jgi:cytochrome c-type biogenesis protein CcmE
MNMRLVFALGAAALVTTTAIDDAHAVRRDQPRSIQSYTTNNLPSQGMVRIDGVVQQVNGNEFVLSDQRGLVDVRTNDMVNLQEGERVTVIGSVQDGFIGREINARKIMTQSPTDRRQAQRGQRTQQQAYRDQRRADSQATGTTRREYNQWGVQPYSDNMSMNDYDARTETNSLRHPTL